MDVFISFSGPLSKAFAELLREWLPEVIQRVKPWISSEDIGKGKLWSNEINQALSIKVGISCVTQENKEAPWLLYEAGALRKGLPETRVCTLLIDLQSQDLQSPLGDFQSTHLEKEDMWRLIKTIDDADSDNALPNNLLRKSFDQRWSDFNKKSEKIRQEHKTTIKAPERSQKEMIVEVLEITRAIRRAVERVESKETIGFSTGLSGVSPPNIALDPGTGPFTTQWLKTLLPVSKPTPPSKELLEAIAKLELEKEKGGAEAYQSRLKKKPENESGDTKNES